MCADACEAAGLEVPELPEEVRESLRRILPEEAGLLNPVDMIATATAEHYRETIRAMAEWDGIDALIVIFIRPLLTRAVDVAGAIEEAGERMTRRIPLQAVFMSPQDHGAIREVSSLPIHSYPEDAARALGRVMRHVEWKRAAGRGATGTQRRRRRGGRRPDRRGARGRRRVDGRWSDASRLLGCYGIADPGLAAGRRRLQRGPGGRPARRLRRAQGAGPRPPPQERDGRRPGGALGGDEVRRAAEEMDATVAARGGERESFFVQAMAKPGPELLIGVVEDATFGPVLACGAGGTQAELLKDVSVRVCPITRGEVSQMLRSLSTFPLLTGYRGAPPVDLGKLEDLLLRVSAMVDAHHEIAEMDLNPVIAGPGGAVAVDYRIRLHAPPPRRPWPRTWK